MAAANAHTRGLSTAQNGHRDTLDIRHAMKGSEPGLTLTVLGCGTLGIAILSGILLSLNDTKSSLPSPNSPSPSGTATPSEDLHLRVPSRFIACVRRPESAKRIKTSLSSLTNNLTTLQNENLRGVQEADVVLLGCKPQMVEDILGEEGMREALKGKLLITILAGVPASQIEDILYGNVVKRGSGSEERCRVVRVLPNTAAAIRESMSVIATSTPPLPAEFNALVTWMFTRIGRVVHLPPSVMDASTALAGSGPAFFALVLEAMADGAVAMGVPRAEAQLMAAQAMRGAAGMVLNGEHPALVREKIPQRYTTMGSSLEVMFPLIIAIIQVIIRMFGWFTRKGRWTGVTIPGRRRLHRWMARPEEALLPTFVTREDLCTALDVQTAMICQFIDSKFPKPGNPAGRTSQEDGTRTTSDVAVQTDPDMLAQPIQRRIAWNMASQGYPRGKGI
ncbi:delta 1-pyrroline-5-carboxylate reductase [Lignoscripta atroalba]|nr:delta 1-pyrroline-5-carboxylate reductase [Lignoscripta atroalba]